MLGKKPAKIYKKEDVISVFGVALSLFSLLVMFSPNTKLWGLSYGINFLLGFGGFWLFCPFLFFVGFYATWKRKIPQFPAGRYTWGFLFVFLSSLLFLTHLGMDGNEKYSDLQPFLNEIGAATAGQNGGLAFDTKLGGGIAGYILSGLLNQSVGSWLVILSFVLLLIVGLFILFFKEVKRAFLAIKAKIAISKSKKLGGQDTLSTDSTDADEPLSRSSSHDSSPYGDVSPSPEPFKPVDAVADETPAPSPAPSVSYPSRRSLYAQEPTLSRSIPQEVQPEPESEPSESPTRPQQTGLQTAFFDLNDAEPRKDVLVKQPDFVPVKPKPVPPKRVVDSDIFAPADPFADERRGEPLQPQEEITLGGDEEEKTIPAPRERVQETIEVPSQPQFVPRQAPSRASAVPPSPSVSNPAPLPRAQAPAARPAPQPQPEPIVQQAPISQPQPEEPTADPAVSQPKAVPLAYYKAPPLNLLKVYPPDTAAAQNEADCVQRTILINKTFQDLNVGARVTSHTIGPSVTRYDVETDPSVSVTTIGRYIKDISVRLGGVATRFEEMVVGKVTSGLEIANKTTTTVSFKEMISSLPNGPKDNLVIPFGKSISGDYVFADLSDFPHMLVSGTTGSGKSIFIHGVIMSLIMRNRPEDLRIVVVDPKRVEMAKYKDLPHLLCPIIRDAGSAKVCFNKLIEEMERRYTLFELAGVSNVRQFNKEYAPSAGVQTLPFIVIFVDEYADLVDTCKDIGTSVVRLAQKARAAGIHLVIATQRPDVNVITGTIKANLAVRVALSVSSAVDSMTILGQGGAEQLAGHGDMLVDCSLVSRTGFTRVQGCMVDNGEIKAVCDFIKAEHPMVYDSKFIDLTDHSQDKPEIDASAPTAADVRSASNEDKYSLIKDSIMTREYTSISQIQREFGVGFPRAGKIFARLQQEGVVAQQTDSASSSKGCRVLVHQAPSNHGNPGSTEQNDVVPDNFAQPRASANPKE